MQPSWRFLRPSLNCPPTTSVLLSFLLLSLPTLFHLTGLLARHAPCFVVPYNWNTLHPYIHAWPAPLLAFRFLLKCYPFKRSLPQPPTMNSNIFPPPIFPFPLPCFSAPCNTWHHWHPIFVHVYMSLSVLPFRRKAPWMQRCDLLCSLLYLE